MKTNKIILLVASAVIVITIPLVIIAIYYFAIKEDVTDTSTRSDTTGDFEDSADASTDNSPSESTRLIFIHHSTGENWLSDYDGELGKTLMDNNYFVSDTNYGWGPDAIGDKTDIGNWWEWFRGPASEEILEALYTESSQNSDYTRLDHEPEGENTIIMFKSCFPNSDMSGAQNDTVPSIISNNLKAEDSSSSYHTIANAKGIYIDLLEYFQDHQDKLFIVITAPPLGENNTTSKNAQNARAFNNWLKNDWLDDYKYDNVVVFDFYDVLTDHGKSNYAQYTNDEYDDHPSTQGNLKATQEFISFLNSVYAAWNE
jgi:hypothetical protein